MRWGHTNLGVDSKNLKLQVGSVGTQSLRKPGGARPQEAVLMGGPVKGGNNHNSSTSWVSGIYPRDRLLTNGNLWQIGILLGEGSYSILLPEFPML